MKKNSHDQQSRQGLLEEIGRLKQTIEQLKKESNPPHVLLSDMHLQPNLPEDHFRLLLENIQLIAVILDTQGNIVFCNEFLLNLTGWQKHEVENQSWFDTFLPPQARPLVTKTFNNHLQNNRNFPSQYENKIIRRDGSEILVFWNNITLRNNLGHIIGTASIGEDIDRQRRAELELREQKEFFDLIANTTPSAITFVDKSGQITYANPQAEKLLGISVDAVTQRMFNDPKWRITDFNGQAFPEDQLAFSLVIQHKKPVFNIQHAIETPDGKRRFLSINAAPSFDAENQFKGVVTAIHDITDDVCHQQELKESQQLYRSLVQASPDAILMTDLCGIITFVSAKAISMFGWSSETQLLKNSWLELVSLADRAQAQRDFQVLLEHSKSINAEYHLIKKEGAVFYGEFSSAVIRDSRGNPVSIIMVLRDISIRKQAESAIQKSEEKYRLLFEKMIDAFALHEVITDENNKPIDYRYLEVNPAFEKMMHIRAENIIGRTVKESFPGIESFWIEVFGNVALSGQAVSFDNYSEALQRHYEVTSYCPGEKQFAVIFVDITDRKEAEKEKIRLQEQLQQAQKMEAIGALAGGIAHDFNNVLAAIMGYAELILDENSFQGKAKSNLEGIIQASLRAKDMIKQILTFSRRDSLECKPLLLKNVLEESLKLVRSSLPATIDISIEAETDLKPILGNLAQMNQIILNLTANAAHAMKNHPGYLLIGLKEKRINPELLKKLNLPENKYQQLSFTDTGMGISQEHISRIFEPYYTTKEVGEGTGMGLAMVHGIVKNHHGFITVESEPGRGTSFYILFPVYNQNTLAESEEKEALIPIGHERILFVDDEADLTMIWKQILTKLGYGVKTCSNSEEALDWFTQNPDAFDMVITDMTMPFMTGLNLSKEIKHIRSDIPIVLCSGYSDQINIQHSMPQTIDAFLLKPINKQELAGLIRKLLDNKNKA